LPIFLDVHKLPLIDGNRITEHQLEELCDSPTDEFGVKYVNLFYNKDTDIVFCLLDAPREMAVEQHHDMAKVKCEWITQVTLAKKT
jgi:Protein of unknown function (DUF4242)